MTESFRSNEAHEWRYPLGSTVRHALRGHDLVVVEHALALGLDNSTPMYALASRELPHLTWVVPADRVHDTFSVAQEPHYSVGKLNPTTWTVCHAAPGPNGLKHAHAQCDSLIAAQRLLVTLELGRRA